MKMTASTCPGQINFEAKLLLNADTLPRLRLAPWQTVYIQSHVWAKQADDPVGPSGAALIVFRLVA